jgi:hypothetical protein
LLEADVGVSTFENGFGLPKSCEEEGISGHLLLGDEMVEILFDKRMESVELHPASRTGIKS